MSANYRTGLWLAIFAAFGFSLKAIFVKLAYHWPIEAITLVTLRMAFSLPFFMAVGWRQSRNAPPLTRRQRLTVGARGLLGYYGASILDFLGLRYISAGLERLILYSYPAITLIIGAVFFGERIKRRDVVALMVCYVGIAIAFGHDLHIAQDVARVLVGGGFVLASSLCFALYLVGSGRVIPVLGSARFTALAMLVSSGAVVLHFVATQSLSALQQPWQIYALGLAMAIFATVLPVFAQSAAIRRLGAARASMVSAFGPVLTIGLSWWILGEPISIWQWSGTALVIGGVILVGRK